MRIGRGSPLWYVAWLLLALQLVVLLLIPMSAGAVDTIEVTKAEKPAICQPQGMLPMPCSFMFAMIQKMMGGGCGERTCPVKL